ncbi:MAG: hypothetical protein LBJ31_11590 [Treponema sp.]|jgi:hypothetical protein|nr:hypothetical protein [Treponema sp.]
MPIEEIQAQLQAVLRKFPAVFDAVDDGTIGELGSFAAPAAAQGMKNGSQLVENLVKVLKSRKAGEANDESVSLRFTALDFYLKNLQSGSTEDL